MYTSCGWFFDELSRIETVQVLAYAARAIQLAEPGPRRPTSRTRSSTGWRRRRSNLPAVAGRRAHLRPAGPPRPRPTSRRSRPTSPSAACPARYGRTERIGCYEVERHDEMRSEAGRASVGSGRVTVRSVVTPDRAAPTSTASCTSATTTSSAGCAPPGDDAAYAATSDALAGRLRRGRLPRHHPGPRRPLRARRVLAARPVPRRAASPARRGARGRRSPTSRPPTARSTAAVRRCCASSPASTPSSRSRCAAPPRSCINAELREALRSGGDPARVSALVEEAERFGVPLDVDRLAHAFGEAVDRQTRRLRRAPRGPGAVRPLRRGPAAVRGRRSGTWSTSRRGCRSTPTSPPPRTCAGRSCATTVLRS